MRYKSTSAGNNQVFKSKAALEANNDVAVKHFFL